MDVFSTKGTVGAASGNAAFLVVSELLAHLKKTSTLSQGEIDGIIRNHREGTPVVHMILNVLLVSNN